MTLLLRGAVLGTPQKNALCWPFRKTKQNRQPPASSVQVVRGRSAPCRSTHHRPHEARHGQPRQTWAADADSGKNRASGPSPASHRGRPCDSNVLGRASRREFFCRQSMHSAGVPARPVPPAITGAARMAVTAGIVPPTEQYEKSLQRSGSGTKAAPATRRNARRGPCGGKWWPVRGPLVRGRWFFREGAKGRVGCFAGAITGCRAPLRWHRPEC